LAAAIANAFAGAYVSTTLELRVAPTREAANWFDVQLKGLRTNVEDAQRVLRADVAAKQVQLARHPERLPQVRDNTYIQQLRADLLHGEAKLEQLSTQYGVNHPLYQSQLKENRALRARLQEEMHKLVAAATDAEAQVVPGRADPQPGSGALDQRLAEPILQDNADSAARAYDTALQRYFTTQVESRANQANAGVLSPAVTPLQPYRPNLPLNLALALVTGLAFGAALIAFLESQDARVRSAEDLAALEVPLLAVLSDQRRLAGLLPRPAGRALRALPRPG
jgi:uncharacterized protein involved in exopolysaccharide biosynthesis